MFAAYIARSGTASPVSPAKNTGKNTGDNHVHLDTANAACRGTVTGEKNINDIMWLRQSGDKLVNLLQAKKSMTSYGSFNVDKKVKASEGSACFFDMCCFTKNR